VDVKKLTDVNLVVQNSVVKSNQLEYISKTQETCFKLHSILAKHAVDTADCQTVSADRQRQWWVFNLKWAACRDIKFRIRKQSRNYQGYVQFVRVCYAQ